MIDLLFLVTRFATDSGVRGTISEEIIKSGEELSLASGSQLSIYLTSEETPDRHRHRIPLHRIFCLTIKITMTYDYHSMVVPEKV